jgi:hypothetical protein
MEAVAASDRRSRKSTVEATIKGLEQAWRFFEGYVGDRCQEAPSWRRARIPSKMRWRSTSPPQTVQRLTR